MLQVAATIAYALITLALLLSGSPISVTPFATILFGVLALILIAFTLRFATDKQFASNMHIEASLSNAFPWLVALIAIAQCNLFLLRGIVLLLNGHYELGGFLLAFGFMPLFQFFLPRASRWTFWASIGLFVGLSMSTFSNNQANATPFSNIQQACSAILDRTNPYDEIYAKEVSINPHESSVELNPLRQLPAAVWTVLPSYYLTGDIRWVLLIALIGSTLLLRSISGASLATSNQHAFHGWLPLALLYHPLTEPILRAGHSAPLIVLAVSVICWSLHTKSVVGKIVGIAGLLSTTLLGMACLPACISFGRIRSRTWFVGIVLATLPLVPFLLWNHTAIFAAIDYRPRSILAFAVAAFLGVSLLFFRRSPENKSMRFVDVPLAIASVFICFQLCAGSTDGVMGWIACAALLVAMQTVPEPPRK